MGLPHFLRSALLLVRPQTGLECEALRVTPEGTLATTAHPSVFGNKLANPFFTTDYAEQQLEMITPPLEGIEASYQRARALAQIAQLECKRSDEFMWPSSMPCPLPLETDIQLAEYDDSPAGREASEYRRLLGQRYSKARQMLSGVHFNFSFNEKFLQTLFAENNLGFESSSYVDFKNQCYLKVVRNFNRVSWLLIYLFGASPVYHETLARSPEGVSCSVNGELPEIEPGVHLIGEGTSARNGQFGYRNIKTIYPDYATLDSYIACLRDCIARGVLSAAKEFYSPIRIKAFDALDILDSLESDGIAYLELRLLDINPFDPARISQQDLSFLMVFMHYLLLAEEAELLQNAGEVDEANRLLVAQEGLKSRLLLSDRGKEREMTSWALEILSEMTELAAVLDEGSFFAGAAVDALDSVRKRVLDKSKTYAARLVELVEREGFTQGLLNLSRCYQEDAYARRWLTPGFEEWEMSTQLLIAESLKRGIKVEPIDQHDNLILLERAERREYVRQCTKTSKDSYITVLLMENKVVSKRIMREAEIRVPRGESFSITEVEHVLGNYIDKPCVIKPKSTNFGIGVVMFEKGATLEQLKSAAKLAAQHDKVIMIEEFIAGPEYRFLTIGNEVAGVLQRVPAHVTGDGASTIAELAASKNKHPYRSTGYRTPLVNIELGQTEAEFIGRQNLNFESVPALNQTVYLRPNSNISTGGESVDVTHTIAPIFKEVALRAARAFDAHFCGVDIIIDDLKNPHSNYGVIEVNFNPAIHIHSFPLHGEEAEIAPLVLKELGLI